MYGDVGGSLTEKLGQVAGHSLLHNGRGVEYEDICEAILYKKQKPKMLGPAVEHVVRVGGGPVSTGVDRR